MSPPPRHRHAVDGGYQRGEETRARIVAAALSLFGERGFDGASTRDIAERAGVNAPAIGYYFDNKEGVYMACVEHIVMRVWAEVSAPVEAAEAALAGNADDHTLIAAFCAIQARVGEFLFTSTESDEWRLFMAREQAGLGPSAGFEMIDQKISFRLTSVNAAIVGRLLGRPADDEETLIRTLSLNGPIAAFHIHCRKSLRVLGWDGFNAARLAKLMGIVKEQTVTLLQHMTQLKKANAASASKTPRAKTGSGRRAS
ncbi:CerR family C-terminal domain-containing protein [Paraburkholderia phenazinium]|jgi:AcrR family transcriptional regulator|uniref:Regulatory protein, tetR family n=1 Tax=Paraburkholderia phenazinium TaxID=60549 RepID=A0A1G8GMP0_9BURK|nr:CerR family C-terminal domain-containing protein [Paraburkholderia phenazinium]SDH95675.1 regulatory protein, tetR family [Paraburkholderia phenazinium]